MIPLRPTRITSGDHLPHTAPMGVAVRRVGATTAERVSDAQHVVSRVPGDLTLGTQLIERLLERDALLVVAASEISRLPDVPMECPDIRHRPHHDCAVFPLKVTQDPTLSAVDLVPEGGELAATPAHAAYLTLTLPSASLR